MIEGAINIVCNFSHKVGDKTFGGGGSGITSPETSDKALISEVSG